MRGRNFGCKAFLGFEPTMVMFTVNAILNAVKFIGLRVNSAGRAPSLRVIPWHLPYN